ncbi:MAG: SURF1 family protein [Burkholderiales bacterium]|nr:SURF1 family protein [Burkholderiales bacterium]
MAIRFQFRWIPFVAAMFVVAVGMMAGQWQTRRAVERESNQAKLEARSHAVPIDINDAAVTSDEVEYSRVRVKGEFVRNWPLYLDNRPHQGRAGFYLLMPLKIAGTDQSVLVVRGWFPRDMQQRTRLPQMVTPDGTIEIKGMARRHADRLFQFDSVAPLQAGAIVQNAEIADVAAASKLKLLPFLIAQTSDMKDGLLRDWPRPASGADKNRAYAFQWYGLALTAFIFFVVTGFRRGTKQQAARQ